MPWPEPRSAAIDLRAHRGVHPRLGAVDVVPFVPLPERRPVRPPAGRPSWPPGTPSPTGWARPSGSPASSTAPERTLPEIRRGAFSALQPDAGPAAPHPTAGACAVGARDVLIAYNVWIRASPGPDAPDDARVVSVAKALAAAPAPTRAAHPRSGRRRRRPGQLQCRRSRHGSACSTSTKPWPRARQPTGCTVWKGELVGLLPRSALAAVPDHRWADVGLRAEDTIEFRLDTRRG